MGALLWNKVFFFFLFFHFGENFQKNSVFYFPHFSDLAEVVVIIHKKY
jgi:hypothetical protein